jgi:hypothetical protein
MDHASVVSPEAMQGEDEFLEGHEQSSRRWRRYLEKNEVRS